MKKLFIIVFKYIAQEYDYTDYQNQVIPVWAEDEKEANLIFKQFYGSTYSIEETLEALGSPFPN